MIKLIGVLCFCLFFIIVKIRTVTGSLQRHEEIKSSTLKYTRYISENLLDESTDNNNASKEYIYIDDMIIATHVSRAGIVNSVWPDGVVPFQYHFSINPQLRILIAQSMNDIGSATCIKFRPVKSDDTYSLMYQSDPDPRKGCASFVGWENMKTQPIQLSPSCTQGNIVHEIIHTLGFYHEHTRNDRDDYVQVNYDNIHPGLERNYMKDMDANVESEYYDVPYNYDSIMHYGKYYFSKNKLPTLEIVNNYVEGQEPLGNGNNIGQREAMSSGDIQMINRKYNCE